MDAVADNTTDDNEGDHHDGVAALMAVVNALKDLDSGERRRILHAAMTYFGETAEAPTTKRTVANTHDGEGVAKWMEQYGVSSDEMDHAFDFNGGGCEIIDVPGSNKKEKTLNAYVLTGLGRFLTTGQRGFDDATARAVCEKVGCYDAPNHASTLKSPHPEFTGEKKKGYSLTNPGIRRGAELVKQIAGAAR
jgi:hypothetical protein